MPEPLLRERFDSRPWLDRLATDLGVSSDAMAWRLYNFGLPDEPPGRVGG